MLPGTVPRFRCQVAPDEKMPKTRVSCLRIRQLMLHCHALLTVCIVKNKWLLGVRMACVVGIMVCYLLGEVPPSYIGRETSCQRKHRVLRVNVEQLRNHIRLSKAAIGTAKLPNFSKYS